MSNPLPATQTRAHFEAPSLLWLEITGKCGLECTHCYAESRPSGRHGDMTVNDWRSVITQAAELGVSMLQFIGGEPTLHPEFASLLAHATGTGLAVEVYTNLTHVKDSWWDLLACPNVSLATSYYSDNASEHDAITRRRGSHARTLANIRQAVARQIPIRAGIIAVSDGQRADQARAELEAIGVTRITVDRQRGIGRGACASAPDVSQLCGNCGRGVAAILPSGDVCPCVFSRWLTVGNVRHSPLVGILASQAYRDAVATIPARPPGPVTSCNPDSDSDDCAPAEPVPLPAAAQRQPWRGCSPDSGGCAPAQDSTCGPVR